MLQKSLYKLHIIIDKICICYILILTQLLRRLVMKNFIKKIAFSVEPISRIIFSVVARIEYTCITILHILKGYKKPSKKEIEYVAKNVTVIYKSFERQKMAEQLYKNIQHYYPGLKVVIADDSKNPLNFNGENLKIINLPFNSGLSYGLNQALKEVKTTYVLRLDDDMLLTRRTDIYNQLIFLENNKKVDLVGFSCITAPKCESPEKNAKQYFGITYNKPMIMEHLSKIDNNHIVVAKSQNIFIARTQQIRKLGWDDNIRMIDHNEFFYRACGEIVSVISPYSPIFHRHNPFDRNYMKFRSDTKGDAKYILEKHSKK